MGNLVKPANTIVVVGDPLHVEKKILIVANMYPGRLVRRNVDDNGIQVCSDNFQYPTGWLGYEQCHPNHQPATVDTIYAVNAYAPVLYGGGFVVVARLANGQTQAIGNKLDPAANGEVKNSAHTTFAVAIALESVDASGGAEDIMVLSLI